MPDYKIIWSHFSGVQIDEIYNYYKGKVSVGIAKKIVKKILLAPDRLTKNPKAGAPETSLQDRAIQYRYILFSNCKIISSNRALSAVFLFFA